MVLVLSVYWAVKGLCILTNYLYENLQAETSIKANSVVCLNIFFECFIFGTRHLLKLILLFGHSYTGYDERCNFLHFLFPLFSFIVSYPFLSFLLGGRKSGMPSFIKQHSKVGQIRQLLGRLISHLPESTEDGVMLQ